MMAYSDSQAKNTDSHELTSLALYYSMSPTTNQVDDRQQDCYGAIQGLVRHSEFDIQCI